MKMSLHIDSENAAFTGLGARSEVSRLLMQVAIRVDQGRDGGHLLDVNGNKCGTWDLEESTEYRCADCGTLSIEEAEGQTCRECGRGIIEEQ